MLVIPNRLPLFSFLLYFSRRFGFALFLRGPILLLIHFFNSFLYIKPFVAIKKQFSIDSFLDWEGHWDIHSSRSSHHH